jgi:hypothetical protein
VRRLNYFLTPGVAQDNLEYDKGDSDMMRPITNRVLERAFEIAVASWKRYAILMLGRDPEADQSGGLQRFYHRNDAFQLYLLAILVKDLRIKVDAAKRHVLAVWRELADLGMLPSQAWDMAPDEIPDVDLWIYNPGLYELRQFSDRRMVGEVEWVTLNRYPGGVEKGRIHEEYEYTRWPMNPPEATGEIYILQLKLHLLRFRYGLKNLL